MPNLPSDLPAWLDTVEAYCKERAILRSLLWTLEGRARLVQIELMLDTDLPIAVQVIRGLLKEIDEANTFAKKLANQYYELENASIVRAKQATLQEARDERT